MYVTNTVLRLCVISEVLLCDNRICHNRNELTEHTTPSYLLFLRFYVYFFVVDLVKHSVLNLVGEIPRYENDLYSSSSYIILAIYVDLITYFGAFLACLFMYLIS